MKAKKYSDFEALLQSGEYHSFEAVCRRLRLCPDDLDETLTSELGYTGDEVMEEYFGNRCKNY